MPVRETQGEKKSQFPALRRRRPSSAAGKSQGDDGGPQEPKINRSGEPSLRSVCFPVLRTPRTRLIRCPAGAPSPVGASPPGSAVGATHALVSHLRAPAAPAAPCTHHPPTPPPRLGPLSPPSSRNPRRPLGGIPRLLPRGRERGAPRHSTRLTASSDGRGGPCGTVTALAKPFTTIEEG